jgi:hypothetical protein
MLKLFSAAFLLAVSIKEVTSSYYGISTSTKLSLTGATCLHNGAFTSFVAVRGFKKYGNPSNGIADMRGNVSIYRALTAGFTAVEIWINPDPVD